MARWMMWVGAVLLAVGAAGHFAPWLFRWLGRLPGDIRVETEQVTVFIPLTSMIIVSVLLSLLAYFFRR
jgi:hypothetical protein